MKIQQSMLYTALSAAMIAGLAGCHSNSVNAQSGPDPAAANLAQPGAENEAQQQAAQYGGTGQAAQQPPAPIERAYPDAAQSAQAGSYAGDDEYGPVDYDSLTDEQATEPPPPLPDYDQPPDPDPDYIWTPGYWAWGPEGYYWVPGAWVAPPYVDALWTPGYWGYVGGVYRFHHGYWGRHVGFYGGIDYGFGYDGIGYEGGYWNGPYFYYNTVITHVDRDRVRNVYTHNVAGNRGPGRISFNGGRGVQARPRPAEVAAIHEQRYAPMQSQTNVRQQASQNRQQFYSANHGRPGETVAARPVVNDHRMPAEMPRAAAARPGAGGRLQPNSGNRPAETVRPGQTQAPAQPGRQDLPRGGSAPEAPRPGQVRQNRQDLQQRPQEARPVQPQNEVRPPTPQQSQARPQNQPRPDQHMTPQPQRQRPEFQQRQEMRQPQPRPQEQMRQQNPSPQAQHSAPQPHLAPPVQPRVNQGPSRQQSAPRPQPQHRSPPPQAHNNEHGGGDGHDRH